MTIPVSPVSIHPQFVQTQQTPGLEMLMTALEHRRQLDLQRQKLQQEQQQFDMNKRLMGAQTEGAELLNLQRKQELKDAELNIQARSEALGIVNGHLDVLRDPKTWGDVWARIKDPRVAGFVQQYRDEHLGSAQKAADLTRTEVGAQQAQLGMAEDRQIHEVLNQFAGREWNRRTIGQAIGRVITINPQKAGQVATALNAMLPDYQAHINDDGTVSFVPTKPGEVEGAPVQPTRPTDEQNKVANYGVRVLEGNATMTDLERGHPGIGQRVDDKISNVRSVEQYPGIGRALATKALRIAVAGMTPEERRYWNARTDLGNALLRRASGAQINMEELDRETSPYAPISGEDEAVVTSKQQRRLQQGLLFAQQSGSAFRPNALSPTARRYLLQSIVPHPGYSPENPYGNQNVVKQP